MYGPPKIRKQRLRDGAVEGCARGLAQRLSRLPKLSRSDLTVVSFRLAPGLGLGKKHHPLPSLSVISSSQCLWIRASLLRRESGSLLSDGLCWSYGVS